MKWGRPSAKTRDYYSEQDFPETEFEPAPAYAASAVAFAASSIMVIGNRPMSAEKKPGKRCEVCDGVLGKCGHNALPEKHSKPGLRDIDM